MDYKNIQDFIFFANREDFTMCEHILKNLSLLERDKMINHKDKLENTLLLNYSYENNLPVCQILIRYKANVNDFNCNGKSPLINAAMNKNDELIELLLENGADPNAVRIREGKRAGANALMFACEKDNLKSIELLSKVTDINYVTDLGHSALMLACKAEDNVTKEKLSILCENLSLLVEKYDKLGGNYLMCLAKRNDLPLLQYCVLQLRLYSPNLLRSIKGDPAITKINTETVEHIETLYNTMQVYNKLDSGLSKSQSKAKGLNL